ncbi:MAG TPA: class I SAM-dependent methyltransferase [Gammaproteobacteria bacterium]|nr:class I SAM-dependent methyltransferase [Gammaproteobacteria bacterium]
MTQNHHELVAAEYGGRAAEYLESAVHASGEDLDQIETALRGNGALRALDLGCGGGHVTYRIAPHVGRIVAVDLADEMLAVVRETSASRGLRNVEVLRSAAEDLPFDEAAFDVVLSRFSAHHWLDFDAGLKEAARVLAPGGRATFVDSTAPHAALVDTYLQSIEVLRDGTHVRNRTAAEWIASLSRAGFDMISTTPRRIRIDFDSWLRRTRTPAPHAQAIRSLLAAAPAEVRSYLAVEADGSFMLDTMTFEAVRGVRRAPSR